MTTPTKAAELADTLESLALIAPVSAYQDLIKAAALLRASEGRVPEGWRLLPVEATREMCAAAVKFANGDAVYKNVTAKVLEIEEGIYGEAYAAMLTAAPHPPAQQAEPLFLLHTGEIDSSGEQAEWEVEHDSQQRVDAFCALNPGVTVRLFVGAPPHKAEGAEPTQESRLRVVERLLDGSQPIDIPGALAVIRHGGATPVEDSPLAALLKLAEDAYEAWDNDRDARVGKLLKAMLDPKFRATYRPDATTQEPSA